MVALYFIIGLLLLLLGRKLFWLFVGLIGFAVGFSYAPELFNVESGVLLFVIAVGIGLIGAALAIFYQAAAIFIGGFFAGGYITVALLSIFPAAPEGGYWTFFVIGGIIGIIILFAAFDYALILISSLAGAAAIINVTEFTAMNDLVIFIVLVVIGIIVQSIIMNKEKGKRV